MSQLIELVNGWSEAWLRLVWAIVWQSTAIAAVAGVVAFFVRRRPALCYWVWQIVAIKLLLMPLWSVWIPVPAGILPSARTLANAADGSLASGHPGEATPVEPGSLTGQRVVHGRGHAPAVDPPLWRQVSWTSWMLMIWLAVIVWRVGGILVQRLALGRLLAGAMPAVAQPVQALTVELARQIGLSRAPPVVLIDCECSPFVCGVWRPKLVLPRSLLEALDATQLQEVILHELAHVKRHDLIFGWAPEIARLVYWFHPVVHWVGYRVQLSRELACDQIAISQSGQGAAGYAQTLVKIVSRASSGGLLQMAAASTGFPGGRVFFPNE